MFFREGPCLSETLLYYPWEDALISQQDSSIVRETMKFSSEIRRNPETPANRTFHI